MKRPVVWVRKRNRGLASEPPSACFQGTVTSLSDWLAFNFNYHRRIDACNKRQLFERVIEHKFRLLPIQDLNDLLPFFLFIKDYKSVKRLIDRHAVLNISSLLKFETTQPGSMNQIIFRLPEEDELMKLLYLFPNKDWDAETVAHNPNFLNISGKPKELKFFYFGGARGLTINIIRDKVKPLDSDILSSFIQKASANLSISIDDIIANPDIPWDYNEVSKRPDITIAHIEKLRRIKMGNSSDFWDNLSANSAIKLRDIETHLGEGGYADSSSVGDPSFVGWPWVWGGESYILIGDKVGISYNSNLTLPFVIKHRNEKWNWEAVFSRPNIRLDDVWKAISRKELSIPDLSPLLHSPDMTPEYALKLRTQFDPDKLLGWVAWTYGIEEDKYDAYTEASKYENYYIKEVKKEEVDPSDMEVYNIAVTLLLRFSQIQGVKERIVKNVYDRDVRQFDLPFEYIISTLKGDVPWDLHYHWSRPDIDLKHIDTIDTEGQGEVWDALSANLAVPFNYIATHIDDYNWERNLISMRPDFDLNYLKKVVSDDLGKISANPVVTTRYIYDHINDVEWEWGKTSLFVSSDSVSSNPNLTVGFVLLYLDKLNFGRQGLSANKFLHNEVVRRRYIRQKLEGLIPREVIPEVGVLRVIQSFV